MKKKFKKIANKLPSIRRRGRDGMSYEQLKDGDVPRITNETVAAHREEVLQSARKYIYPLQHSKHRIVLISTTLFIVTVVVFFTYCTVALYRLQSDSSFLYRVTQVIPFPVAKAGSRWVAYENYLFELRHYRHYYQNQLKIDFDDPNNKGQFDEFKKRALDKVVNDAYIKQLADEHGITVSEEEVNHQIDLLREQNRLGGSEKVFEDVLKDFWNWSVDDFKRSLRQQILSQKVVAALDTETQDRARAALSELNASGDFVAAAAKYSDDGATKDNGGEFGFMIDLANRDLSPQTTEALFSLEPGQHSDIINIGYALEIVKHIEKEGERVRGAHILFTFKEANTYINDLKEEKKARLFIAHE